ncbi:MAG TPA: DUF3857 domain-containing protein [Candidatus Acidoferrum sp.]|nr:DUF3857 domain-containing protein [Candidatus Acidoferrum sp.]
MKAFRNFPREILCLAAIWFLGGSSLTFRAAQAAAQNPEEKSTVKVQENTKQKQAAKAPAKLPAEIELLETRIRFETEGSSRKEVHAVVRINNELGVRQFGRLNFDFNRSFQQVEIPLVRITHTSGGTIDVLPSAITDQPNPAVVDAPAYQDVRVKSVRILGLEPGDSLEYRVITTTKDHPRAPDFWFEHSFDRSGVVRKEICVIDLPASLAPTVPHWGDNMPQPQGRAVMSSGVPTPEPSIQRQTVANEERVLYKYEVEDGSKTLTGDSNTDADLPWPDVQVGFMPPVGAPSWAWISHGLYAVFVPHNPLPAQVVELALKLIAGAGTDDQKTERIYDFVSQKIKTVDLPLGATGFHLRPTADVAASGYASQEDKIELFMAMAAAAKVYAGNPLLIGPSKQFHAFIPTPSAFVHILLQTDKRILDPSLEVAPFGMLPASYRGSEALNVGPMEEAHDGHSLVVTQVPKDLPFASSQKVRVDAAIDSKGTLSAKAQYAMRGDNELLLRVAFHSTPKGKWNEVAQLLALSDGFRGKVSSVTTSDPYETHSPFTVEYEIAQPKFVDWSKNPVRIPALLPLLGLPDPASKAAASSGAKPIDLGTPLDVQVSMTLHLPPGTSARVPTGTSVERDFATYTSQYSAKDSALTASRHLNFILREIPADRAADYNAFLQAVQNDESQTFGLEHLEATTVKPQKP